MKAALIAVFLSVALILLFFAGNPMNGLRVPNPLEPVKDYAWAGWLAMAFLTLAYLADRLLT